MKSRLKQIGKDSIVYGLGGIIAKGINFLLLPVYTRIFPPSEYGIIEMLTILNGFLAMLLGMGMDSAQSFYFFEQKLNGQRAQSSVVTAIFQWRLTWGLVIVVCATLLSPLLNRFFFNGQLSWEYFAIAFAGSFFFQIMLQSAELFRLLYNPWKFISITFSQTVIAAVVALLLIIEFGYGIKGYFIGSLTGAFIAAISGWFLVKNFLDLGRWHREWWPRMLKFGAPLVPAGLAMYILNTSDRWFVNYFAGPDALGIYAVGAKFAMFVTLAVTTFRQAWWPVAMDAMHSQEGPLLFRTIGRFYLGCGSIAVVMLTAVSPYLVRLLAAPNYYYAYPLVGVLSWYAVFYGFYLIGAGGIWKAEKTILTPLLMGFAAIMNILLDIVLVPKFGGMGAAAATSFSFAIWTILSVAVSERLWKINYDYLILGIQVLIGVSATVAILYFYNTKTSSWSVAAITTGSCLLLVWTFFSHKNYALLIQKLKRKFSAVD